MNQSIPTQCPSCATALVVSRLQCPACGTEVAGVFRQGRLINLPEPHASLLEMFLRVRGNVKEMERELGLSYPTVRARLEKAIVATGLDRDDRASMPAEELAAGRTAILEELAQGVIDGRTAAERHRAHPIGLGLSSAEPAHPSAPQDAGGARLRPRHTGRIPGRHRSMARWDGVAESLRG